MVRGITCGKKLWNNDWCASVSGLHRPGVSFVRRESKERRLMMLGLIRSNLMHLESGSVAEWKPVDLFILNQVLWYEIVYQRKKLLRWQDRSPIEPEFVACTNWLNSL